MRNCSFFALASALALVSCARDAAVRLSIKDAPEAEVVVKRLEINTYSVLDTIVTDKSGKASYKVGVEQGQPEFIYMFKGDTKIASLLLEKGEKVSIEADTVGNYTVSGSAYSEELKAVEKEFSSFLSDLMKAEDSPTASRLYVDYYRKALHRVMTNPKSLTSIPVLFQRVNERTPVFAQKTDAVIFRTVCDSLKTVYPQSRYVKALEKETVRREKVLELDVKINNAEVLNFPDLELPSMTGEKVALSSVKSKAVLVHFWDAADPSQSSLNIEFLLPLYRKYHSKGLEIYSVCLTADKVRWAGVVNSQKLPWINLNDGRGYYSVAPASYNITSLPSSILILDGEIVSAAGAGEDALKKKLAESLK